MATFRDAMDVICLTAADAADVFEVQPQTIRQMRLDASNPSHRTPPPDWPAVLAGLAEERAERLHALARELREG